VLHAKTLPGNPHDGHPLRDVIEDTQKLTGCEIERGYVDKGYRGHDKRTRAASSSPDRSAACSASSSANCDAEKGRAGDAANAILTAVGYNFRRILAWLGALLRLFLIAILRTFIIRSALNSAC